MKTAVSPISFPLLVMTLLLSTIFSSGIGTATAQEFSVIATIPVGLNPLAIAVNPTNGLVYVTSRNSTGSVIDSSTNTVIATIPVGQEPFGIAVNPTNGLVYVSHYGIPYTVSVIDPSTNTVVATIPVGTNPSAVAVNPTNGLVYVTNAGSNTVSVIDTSTNTVVATIPLDTFASPFGIAVNPTNGLVYVTNSGSNTVSVIDPSTNTVIATIPVGQEPFGVAVNPTNGLVYVVNVGSNTVSVISAVSQPPTDTTPPMLSSISAVDGNNVPVANLSSTFSTSITFTFEFVDDVGGIAGIECSLDGSQFSACTSPITFNNLAASTHTFQVRATDTSGNTNPTPVSFTWTVVAVGTLPPLPDLPPQPPIPQQPPIPPLPDLPPL
jgi:YVTN family beta-propeller protein